MNNQLPFWLEKHTRSIKKVDMHHAFLVSGRKGIGKDLLVRYLSSMTLCNDVEFNICKSCNSCKFSTLENHPDFYELQVLPDKKLIGISQIHELRNKLYESSFLGKNKVAFLPNLEKISIDGLNAILKILEEPPTNTFFFLTTNFLNQIPQTIQSRSFDIKISPPEHEESIEWLSDYPKEDAAHALRLNNNLPLAAKEFLDNGFLKIRKDFIAEISGIIKEGKDMIALSEQWTKDESSLNIKLEWMSLILSDTIRFNADQTKNSLNPDTDNISKYLSKKSNLEKLHQLLNKTNSLWNLFSRETNLRRDYQLNSLFVDWENDLGISKKI
jgi:DNA polymerase-3 subunit delta'